VPDTSTGPPRVTPHHRPAKLMAVRSSPQAARGSNEQVRGPVTGSSREPIFVRRPWLGLSVCLVFVATCVLILLGSPDAHLRRGLGLPAWVLAAPGAVFFGWLSTKYLRLIGEHRRRD
jgi:hypothetical protein